MIGRVKERQELLEAYHSEYSEFVAVYGRRRVGKTFLVRETFNYEFTFEHAGNSHAPLAKQLEAWYISLRNFGWKGDVVPKNWLEAFGMLNDLIKSSRKKKKVVFIDEMPWMDTPRSFFVSALEYFWNNLASARKDVLLIICGSATSWIINKVIKNHGGLHNRITHQIHLQPFTLHECELYMRSMHIDFDRYDIIKGYMVFGGVPYYWSLFKHGRSIDQDIDELIFNPAGKLHSEFYELYDSLFRSPEDYIKVVTILGKKRTGLNRDEIISLGKMSNNGRLSKILQDLEYCGFIRRYQIIGSLKDVFQLMDNFTLFYFKFIDTNKENDPQFWTHSIDGSTYKAWCGLAFERVCLYHVPQIKTALGIAGVRTKVYAWSATTDSETDKQGAQIDLVIDRADHVVNLCEMKFHDDDYVLTQKDDKNLRNKKSRLSEVLTKRKTIFLTMITPYGLKQNMYSNRIANVITANDLCMY